VSKAKRKQRAIEKQHHDRRRSLLVLSVIVLVVIGGVSALYFGMQPEAVDNVDDNRQAALASEDSPSIGNPEAAVHIVEFLDPACGTCALFFPMVKGWLREEPDRLRLSVRHVAFHEGAEYAVKVLEASRKQGKYWETLEALLASQNRWVTNHIVQPDRVLPAIAGVGLDTEQLLAEMNAVDVLARIEKDRKDAVALRVSATPEYFVNGRRLPSFGQQQLLDLVREELQNAD
jgi:protein-disulfide isomerase